jgi:hypothetical protein
VTLVGGAWRASWHWYELHATHFYCGEVERQVGLWRFWRTAAFVGGVLLLVFARALGRRAEREWTRVLLGSAARIGVAIGFALAVSELLLHAGSPRRDVVPYLDADWVADARYGWRPAVSRVTDRRVADRTVRFVTDANGYRVRSADTQIDFARPTILSTGESVASGYALDYDETYAAMLGDDLGVQVANIAVTAYGIAQAHLRLGDELPRFARPLATVTMVLPLALDRDGTSDVRHLAAAPDGLLAWVRGEGTLLGRSRVFSLMADAADLHSDRAIDRTRALLTATARVSVEHGAFPLFVLLDWPTCLPDETGAPSIERTLFEGLSLTHVRVHLPREDYDRVTLHPTARGQRTLADAIERALVEHGTVARR